MTIVLSELEGGAPFMGKYAEAIDSLQKRLARAHFAHIIHRARSIILFEGGDASGKGGTIRRLTSRWEPRYFEVHPIGAPSAEAAERHFLWRFWRRLPASRQIAIFDRSWYGRVLVERVEGFAAEEEWRRAYDEINEFEAQQTEIGTNLIKIFLHVTQEEQDRRLAARLDTPHKAWKVSAEDFRNREKRDEYMEAYADMFAATDMRWAPWAAFDANDKKAARIEVLSYVAERLETHVPAELPPPDRKLIRLAEKAFGYEPNG